MNGLGVRIAALLCCGLASTALPAQDSRPSTQDSRPSAELTAAVEGYFAAEDAAAEPLLQAILARPDATAERLYSAVTAEPAPVEAFLHEGVPWGGDLLHLAMLSPGPRDARAPRLPVVYDISGGGVSMSLPPQAGYLVARVNGYTPPQFSDEGRDGFLKMLRHATWRFRGDPDRLWLTGFSWAGHASFDTALHRPHWLRGIAAIGGGPRRVHFRILPNLYGSEAGMWCGQKDDAELVWNLKEVAILGPKLGFVAPLHLDPEAGHTFPLKDYEQIPARFVDAPARTTAEFIKLLSRPILADSARVETPLVRIDAVDEKRVEAPPRIAVDPTAGYDEQRRRTLKGYEKFAVRLTPTLKVDLGAAAKDAATSVVLEADGVKAATVFLRAPFAFPGRRAVVKAKGRVAFDGPAAIDRAVLLREVRRTGERIRPAFAAVSVAF